MIELPFGNGITAAIVFFVFELVLIPILIDSTSRAASFFVHWRAKKDMHIRVSSFQYPLWNEGLFSREWSHIVFFLFRMICIVIPVYLETRLEYKEQPVMVTRSLPNAFVITSKVDPPFKEQVLFRNETSDFSNILNTCSYVDAEGWLIARLANVTYVQGERHVAYPQFEDDLSLDNLGNEAPLYDYGYSPADEFGDTSSFDELGDGSSFEELAENAPFGEIGNNSSFNEFETTTFTFNLMYQVFCLDGTEETLFRVIETESIRETDPYSRDPNVTLHLSPKIVDSFSTLSHLKINAIVSDVKGIECFIPVQTTWFQPEKKTNIYCHKKNGTYIDLYKTSVTVDVFREQNTTVVTPAEALVNIVPESLTTVLQFVAAMEFKEQIMLDAEFLAKQEPEREELDFSHNQLSQLYHDLGIHLYSKTENKSVTMAGDSVLERTILDNRIIIIGAIELSVIFLFGLGMQLCFTCYAHGIQRPNTVDGLSESWSRAVTPATASMESNRIRLRLRKRIVRGVEKYVYEPATTNDHEERHKECVMHCDQGEC